MKVWVKISKRLKILAKGDGRKVLDQTWIKGGKKRRQMPISSSPTRRPALSLSFLILSSLLGPAHMARLLSLLDGLPLLNHPRPLHVTSEQPHPFFFFVLLIPWSRGWKTGGQQPFDFSSSPSSVAMASLSLSSFIIHHIHWFIITFGCYPPSRYFSSLLVPHLRNPKKTEQNRATNQAPHLLSLIRYFSLLHHYLSSWPP